MTALALASGCARLIGADFDRTGSDGGADTSDDNADTSDGNADRTDGETDKATGTTKDAGDASMPLGDGGDAKDADEDGRDDASDATDGRNETDIADKDTGDDGSQGDDGPDGGDLPDVLDPDARDDAPDGGCGKCPDNQLCCGNTCKPIDVTNCFGCGVFCDSTQPVCAPDVQACACTDTSCPKGQVCVAGACFRSSVLPMSARKPWTRSAYYGNVQTSFADVDHDGRADAIVVNSDGITVYQASSNGGFSDKGWTPTGSFIGARGTVFADVTGDGCADAIAVGNSNIIVRRSNCVDAFGDSESWGPRDDKTLQTSFADANGDGCADAIDVEEQQIVVRTALPCPASSTTAAGFNPSFQPWTSNGYYGGLGTYFADVTGDRRADAIVLNLYGYTVGVTVRRSDGTQFLQNERWWAEDSLYGTSAFLFADVTGDHMADLVAVMPDGAYMLRSNRWFFGSREQLSDELFSPSRSIRGGIFALTDVTGDGRADLIQVNDDNVWVNVTVDRRIPIRFVQLVENGASPLAYDQLRAAVAGANQVYRPAGLQFFLNSSEVVTSAALSDLRTPGSASMVDLAAAADTFNPNCDLGTDLAGAAVLDQMQVVAARCALDGEILVYVTRVASSTALLPWEGKAFFMDPADLMPAAPDSFRFAHEIGHHLGLPHVFGCCGDNALSHPDLVAGNIKDPSTGQNAPLSLFWDLVYAPDKGLKAMFDDAASASLHESALTPIQATRAPSELTTGWYCPSGDATRSCNPMVAPGTICLEVSDVATGAATYCSGDRDLKGLGLRLPDDTPAVNVMSAGYALPMPDTGAVERRQPMLSLSQVEQIHRVLSNDIDTPIVDTNGKIITGGRPLLGR